MNGWIRTFVLALAVAVVPVTAHGQDAGAPHPGGPRMRAERPAAQMLMRNREALRLTDAQVTQLEAIQERLTAMNAPLVTRLREAGLAVGPAGGPPARGDRGDALPEPTPEQREELRERRNARGRGGPGGPLARGGAIPEELRPVLEEIRTNALAASEEARAVLTAEQVSRLRELRPMRPGGRRAR